MPEKSTTTTEIATRIPAELKEISLEKYCIANLEGISEDFHSAALIGSLRAQLKSKFDEDIMAAFMELQNSNLGFKTDIPGGYPEHIVRDCITDAFMIGLMPTGNEFNIIGGASWKGDHNPEKGKLYITKEGFEKLAKRAVDKDSIEILIDWKGFKTTGDYSYTSATINYSVNGEVKSFEMKGILVKSKAALQTAVESKIQRKAYRAIWQREVVKDILNTMDVADDEVLEIQQLNKSNTENSKEDFSFLVDV